MFAFQEKITSYAKTQLKKKRQAEDTKKSSEAESNMAQALELLDR